MTGERERGASLLAIRGGQGDIWARSKRFKARKYDDEKGESIGWEEEQEMHFI